MRTVASENEPQGSRRGRSGLRAAFLRKLRLRSVALDRLEERLLLSTLPAPLVAPQTYNPNGGNAYAIDNISANNAINGNDSTPAVAIDPQNSQNMVAVWVVDNPAHPLNIGSNNTTAWIEAAYSNNGGSLWQPLGFAPQSFADIGVVPPSGAPPFYFSQYTDPNVAFDGQHNFYVTSLVHSSTYNSGEVLLQKYSFTGVSPTRVITNQQLYQWVPASDPVYMPTLAVDDSTPPDPSQLLASPYGVAYAPGNNPNGNVYVSSQGTNRDLQYSNTTGAFVNAYATGGAFAQPQYLAFHNGNLYTANPGSQSVSISTPNGGTSTSSTLIQGDTLKKPQGAAYGPDGNLYVASRTGNSVLEFDGTTGAFIKDFINPNQDGLSAPDGLVFDKATGNLYVSSAASSSVLVFQGPTNPTPGQLVKVISSGVLNQPGALAFGPTGNLYIANPGTSGLNADSVALYNGASASNLIQGYRLSTPRGVVFNFDPTVGPSGTEVLLVASRASNSILEYDAVSGAFIKRFAFRGGANDTLSQLNAPDSLLVDNFGTAATNPDFGSVYVTTGTNQVLRFTASGAANPAPGKTGAVFASGNMINPTGLAFDPLSGDLFVASTGTNQVVRFQGAVTPGSPPTAKANPGLFTSVYASASLNLPFGIAFGPDNNLYVSNSGANDVLSFQGTALPSPGQFITNYTGSGSGGLNNPQGITFGPDGNLYVASGNNSEVLEFLGPGSNPVINPNPNPGNTFIQIFESANRGGLNTPYGLAFGPDGNLYVASQNTNQVLQYADVTRPNNFISNFASIYNPTGIAVDTFGTAATNPDFGNLYVSIGSAGGTQLGMVVQYSAAGVYQGTFALPGSSLHVGGVNAPEGIAFGPDGRLYIADSSGVDRYTVPTPVAGTFLRGIYAPSGSNTNAVYVANGTGALIAGASYDLVFDPKGNLDITSQTTNQVLQYFGPASATPGSATPLNNFAAVFTPSAVAFDPTHNIVYVANSTGNMVEMFDATTPNLYLGTFIAPNSGIVLPTDLVFDTNNSSPNFGDLFVSSLGTKNVVKYNAGGAFLGTLAVGTQDPEGLAIDSAHNIYISDATNNQVLRYDSSGTPNPSPGNGGAIFVRSNLGGLSGPRGLAIDPVTGDLLVASVNTNQVLRFTPNGTVAPANGNSGAIFINAGNATFTDPTTGATQTDPYYGNVYVAWSTFDFLTPSETNGQVIRMTASSDGGQSFTTPITVSTTASSDFSGTLRDYAPHLSISQERPAGTLGAGDPGVPGGQVSIVWDRSNFTDGLDRIMFRRISDAGTAANFTGAGGGIADGIQATPNHIAVDSPFFQTVNITDPKFLSISDLNVVVNLTNPAVGELSISLLPPPSTGITTPITLMLNAVNTAGTTSFPNRGVSGTNLGATPNGAFIGLVFDDQAARPITGQSNPTGYFRPEGSNLDNIFKGMTPTQLNGTWTLIITQNRNHGTTPPPSFLNNWTLQFTSGLVPGSNPNTPPSPPLAVATTPIHGSLVTPGIAGSAFPLGPGTESVIPVGIGPSPVIAADRTLGSFSPHEGYLYIAYVYRDRLAPGNPADNTDIYMVTSTNGGLNWSAPVRVNTDVAATDGFSQGAVNDPLTGRTDGRPQFEPAVAVDQTTGTLVVSYLDAGYDAADARVTTAVTTSIDGGQTFSPATYANLTKTATDAITNSQVNLGPIPDNQSSGNPLTDAAFGFGIHQGLAVMAGHIFPVWSSNRNGDYNGSSLLGITTTNMTMATGPRIISSQLLPFTMGPVQSSVASNGTPFNNQHAADGRLEVNGFLINFDRPIDPSSFTTADVKVFFHDPNPVSGGDPYVPILSGLSVQAIPTPNDPANLNNKFGYTQFLVTFTPQSAVGTYSYEVGPFNGGPGDIQDRVRSYGTTFVPQAQLNLPSTDTPLRVPTSGFGGTGTSADITTSTLNFAGGAGQFITGVTIDLSQLNFPAAGLANLSITLTAPNGVTTNVPSSNGVFFLSGLNGSQVSGNYTLTINDTANTGNANYFGTLQSWSIKVDSVKPTPGIQTGNVMDQNANGLSGQAPSSAVGVGDIFAAPTPTASTFTYNSGQFFPGPYNQDTQPIILAGPHVVDTSVPNVPATSDNLVQNRTNNALDVTFDRNITVGSFDSSQVLRIMGPTGQVGLPVIYTAPLNFLSTDPKLTPINVPANIPDAGPNNSAGQLASTITIPNAYAIKNLTVTVNLTHAKASDLSVFLIGPGSTPIRIQLAAVGSLSGPNVNLTFSDAGANKPVQALSAFDGQSIQGTWTLQILDNTAGNVGTLNSWSLHSSQAIPDNNTTTPLLSTLVIPPAIDPVTIGNLTVNLSVTHPHLGDLSFYLISPGPNPVTVQLVQTGSLVGQNLANTTFDDTAPTTLGQNVAPYTGTFRPAQPLSSFKGMTLEGTWTLKVVDSAAGSVGTVDAWSMTVTPAAVVTPSFPAPISTPVSIPDNVATPVLSTLTINPNDVGPNFTIQDLKVNLDITHTRTSDLAIYLISPSDANHPTQYTIPLVQAGSAVLQNFTDTTFSDSAEQLIGNNMGPYTGTFAPAQSLDASLKGLLLSGTWTLKIVDNAPGGGTANTLNGWSLLATPTTPSTAWAKTFRVVMPRQQLSGTYTVTLGSGIKDTQGEALDSNLNAGVYALFPQLDPNPATVAVKYPAANPVTTIPDGGMLDSFLAVPDNFQIQSMTLTLNITHPNDPDLEAILMPPGANGDESQGIILFNKVGATGTHANFNNTTFDDTVFPFTPISNGSPPFLGSYNPAQALSKFTGLNTGGTWTLRIKDLSGNGQVGTLNSWSLTFQKAVPHTGLGEPVADQTTATFRIFTTDPTNPLSSNTWTSVGPASTSDLAFGINRSGRIGGLAVDSSDPSGNTVYIGGASGGIWKTTNFLTTDPAGPTYIPLTDFGPTFGINIGGLAVFGRNNDPNQSIIFAATGEGDTSTRGVGFLRSTDGGANWTLLDSTNNNLPFAQRDHLFSQNTSYSYKIVVDPTLNANGLVNVYAAISGAANVNGIWVSQDSGQTWNRVLQGNATDVLLDPASGTGANGIDPKTQAPTGNLQDVYAAIRGQGVYLNVSQGFGTWNLVDRIPGSPSVTPLIQDGDLVNPPSLAVGNPTTPNGAKGRIVLAKPFLTKSAVLNQIYQGWLYALVLNGNTLDGLYLTKDFGQNWTNLQIPIDAQLQPSNNENLGQADPFGGQGDYNVSLAIDPTNPNIVYIGGSLNGNQSGFIRVDATKVLDAHNFVPFDNSRPDGGQLQVNTTGGITLKNPAIFPQQSATNPNTSLLLEPPTNGGTFQQAAYLNLIRDPQNQFATNATLFTSNVSNTAGFTNSGANVTWIPFDLPGVNTDQHRILSMVDPLTGHARLIMGSDQGVFTLVDNNGTFDSGFGQSLDPNGDRNGNLQITQFYYGAVQPSNANLLNQIRAVTFYGGAQDTGDPSSGTNPATNDTLSTGQTQWTEFGPGDGTGVATDQTGTGTVYRFVVPADAGTNFFQVQPNGQGAFIGRTFGLTTGNPDPQWPQAPIVYPGGMALGNFAVNPIDGNQIVISSNVGRIFRTENQGGTWSIIGNPADLDSSYAGAMAFGAPDPAAAQGKGNHDNFIYAGTVSGNIFVTTSGGGSAGSNAWTKISTGLDGSGVMQIIPDPTPGSHDAYAVTLKGVYYIADSTVANATWQNITGNLFSNQISPFGISSFSGPQLSYLTSIAVDWRYVIPNNPTVANGPTHPMLYVGGEGGVYRSTDFGKSWQIFPNIAFDGSPANGGYLPNAHVTSLAIAVGNINPTTGRALAKVDVDGNPLTTADDIITSPDILMASTFGRGTFSIRLAPVVFPNTNTFPQPNNFLYLDPSTDTGVSSNDQYTRDRTPIIDGLSSQSAFGNTVTVNLYDHDLDPNHLNPIGTGQTDASGKFSIQITVPFLIDGRHTIDVQATDQSGTKGNVASFTFILKTVPPGAPGTPILDPLGDSGIVGDNITQDNNATSPPILDVPGNAVGSVVTLQRAQLSYTTSPVSLIIPANGSLTTTIAIPAAALTSPGATLTGLMLDLSKLTFATPNDLTITLKAPDGTTVTVPSPYTGSINLSALLGGHPAAGTYTLKMTNAAANTGTLGAWSLTPLGVTASPLVVSDVQPSTYVAPGTVLESTVTIPAASLTNPNERVPGLVLDLSRLIFPTPGDLTILLTGPDGTTIPVPAPYGNNIPLTGLNGKLAAGAYTLTVINGGTSLGTLGTWSLMLAGVNSGSTAIGANATVTSSLTIPQSAVPSVVVPANGSKSVTLAVPASALSSLTATIASLSLDLSKLAAAPAGSLTVTLTDPDGTVVPITAPFTSNMSVPGLVGKQAAGNFTLTITSTAASAVTLSDWSMTLVDSGSPTATVYPYPSINDGVILDLSNLSFPTLGDLSITLTGPDGTVVPVPAPYGRFLDLASLNTRLAYGNYTLTITNAGSSAGSLGSWSLALPGTITTMTAVNSVPGATTGAPPVTVKVPDTNAGNGTIADGSYLYSAFQTDQAGNIGQLGPGQVVTIETTGPLGLPPLLTHDTDTGLPRTPRDSDNITNEPQPAFEGTVEPNATVQLYINGVAAGTGQADATGHFRIIATVAMTEGLNDITIVELDVAGNAGPTSIKLTVRLDTTPPPGISPTLAPSSDTGLATVPSTASDNQTSINNPTFTGTAEISPYLSANPTALTDGTLVQLFAQLAVPAGQQNNNPSILVGEALANPITGAYTVTVGQYVNPQPGSAVTSLSDGTYDFSVVQTDVAGNSSQPLVFGNTGAVVIDGTDADHHGAFNTTTQLNDEGWAYMQSVLNLIQPNVTNGEKTLVALGVHPTAAGPSPGTISSGGFFNDNGNANGAIYYAFLKSVLASKGWNLVIVNGAANIDTYLSGGAAAAVDSSNKSVGTITLSSTGLLYITTVNHTGDDLTNAELQVIDNHGPDIKNYVNRGGGLYSQSENPSGFGGGGGTAPPLYGWLSAIFPNITAIDVSNSQPVNTQITAAGQAIFPSLTPAQLSGGPWHNFFSTSDSQGSFGALAVAVTEDAPAGTIVPAGTPVALVLTSAGGSGVLNPTEITIDTDGPQPQPVSAPVLEAGSDSGPGPLDGVTNYNNSGTTHPAPIFDVANVEAGAQVQLFRNGVLVNTVINGATAGTVAIADINQSDPFQAIATPPVPGPAIPDGTYTYTVVVTDLTGVAAPASTGTTVKILATAPATPFNLTLLSATDTGTFNNDAVTSYNNSVASPSNAPLFSVSGIADNTVVKLLRNGLVVTTLNVTTGGTIQIADTNNGNGTIADGKYTYRVQQVDLAGNVSSVSLGVTVTIDDTAPAAPSTIVLDPSTDSGTFNFDNITFFNNSTPSLAPIFDVSGVEASATLQLFRNGVLVNTLTNTAGGTVQIADTNNGNGTIADGVYTYTVLQIDLAGNVGPVISSGVQVTIAATPPSASPVRLDANSDTGISNSDGITQVTLFHFPVFDVTGVVPGATVNLYRNNVVVATLSDTAGGTVLITDSNTIPDGTYTYTAQQIDLAGNIGNIGSPIQVTYDTVVPGTPAAPVLSPGGGNHSSVNNPSFTIANIESGATVKLLRDGLVVAIINNASPSGASSSITMTDPGPVPGGTHVYQAFAVDKAGNTSPIGPSSGGITFSPNAPTSITLDPSTDSGATGDNITNATKPVFDIAGIAAGSTVRLIRNGNVVATLTSATGGTVQITDPGPLVNGTYVYTAQQVDGTGTASPLSSTLTVTVATSAATPSLALDPASDSGAKGDNITNVKSPTFDVGNIAAGATVTLSRNGNVVATLTGAAGGTVQITDPGPVQPDGAYTYTAQQTDGAGNVSAASLTVILTINSAVPTAPTLALDPATDTGTQGDGITSNTRPTIDINGVLPGATATLTRSFGGSSTVVKTITNTTGSTASFSFTEPSSLIGGQYTYTSSQTSAAGGVSAVATLTVTIDTTLPPPAPQVALDTASDSGVKGDGITTVTSNLIFDISNVLAGAAVTLFRNNAAVGTAIGTAAGTVTITDVGPLNPGTYTYTAQQVSPGGTSPVSASFSLTVSAPVTPGNSGPVQGDYNADGKTDFALFYRQPNHAGATWYVPNYTPASGVPFGSTKLDVPIQGDFNGDGHVDFAVYRPSTAQWFVGGQATVTFGMANVDIPVPGDYDGIGKTQYATYRPTTGQWLIGGHAQPVVINVPGYKPLSGDIPAPADYDGTGKLEEAIYRPSTGQWFIAGHSQPITYGGPHDVPVPGNYDGVGHAEIALYRPATSQWFVAGSPAFNGVSYGSAGDVPVPGDYDGVGKSQIATYRPNTGQWFIAGHAQAVQYGGPHLVPAGAPYAYRALTGTLSVKSVTAHATTVSHNLGVTAAALSSGSTGQGTPTAAPSVFTKATTTTRVRPNTLGTKNAKTLGRQFVNARNRPHGAGSKAKFPGGPAAYLRNLAAGL